MRGLQEPKDSHKPDQSHRRCHDSLKTFVLHGVVPLKAAPYLPPARTQVARNNDKQVPARCRAETRTAVGPWMLASYSLKPSHLHRLAARHRWTTIWIQPLAHLDSR